MNPGIYYLYEYQNKKRRRNVGFLKVARHYQSCILQIHIRGIGAGNGSSLELWAFCLHGGDMVGSQIAALTCFNRTVSARLPVSESTFPEEKPLPEIDGFLVRFPGGNPPVFWIASDQFLDADPETLREPLPESESGIEPDIETDIESDVSAGMPEPVTDGETPSDSGDIFPENEAAEPPAENESPAENELSAPESVSEPAASPDTSRSPEESSGNLSADRPVSQSEDLLAGQSANQSVTESEESSVEQSSEDRPSAKQVSTESHTVASAARKIQRSDLSRLPRKFWPLANNSFLLHGYHNYAHLLLVDEDGRMWLGVPGIYDPREARAAELFGFPQFTRAYVRELDLSEEERNDDADFGHWCRYLDSAR